MSSESEIDSDWVKCWCGAEGHFDEMFNQDGLSQGCGGSGTLYCECGGDHLCVCHYHGECECSGCEDCEHDDDRDFFDDWRKIMTSSTPVLDLLSDESRCRELFEKWYDSPTPLKRNGDFYLYMGAQSAWVAWRSAWLEVVAVLREAGV